MGLVNLEFKYLKYHMPSKHLQEERCLSNA